MGKGKTKAEAPAPTAPPSTLKSIVGYLIGAGLGLLILLVVSRLLTQPPSRVVDELPHLAIMAEFDDLADAQVRKELCDLHRALTKLDLAVSGPLNYPILVPSKGDADATLHDLDALTPEELQAAAPYFPAGGWLVPRVYSSDLKSCVLRAAPAARTSGFTRDTRARVDELLSSPDYSHLRLTAYSHALELDDPEARAKINLTFGVQTAIVEVRLDDGSAAETDVQKGLLRAVGEIRADKRVRSATAWGSFVVYVGAVNSLKPNATIDDLSGRAWTEATTLSRSGNLPPLTTSDGRIAFVEATTDAEGPENRSLCFLMKSELSNARVRNWTTIVRRQRW
jgi:hypothetical protein